MSRHKFEYQNGAILVISLIMTLVMTTMGIGLFYVANKNLDQVDSVTNRSETLYSAETCVDEIVRWLNTEANRLALEVPPSVPCEPCATCTLTALKQTCHTIGDVGDERFMGTDWKVDGEISAGRRQKLDRTMQVHQYDCDVRLVAIQQSNTKYVYKIRSRGTGPRVARTDLEVMASLALAGNSSGGGSDIGQDNDYKKPNP